MSWNKTALTISQYFIFFWDNSSNVCQSRGKCVHNIWVIFFIFLVLAVSGLIWLNQIAMENINFYNHWQVPWYIIQLTPYRCLALLVHVFSLNHWKLPLKCNDKVLEELMLTLMPQFIQNDLVLEWLLPKVARIHWLESWIVTKELNIMPTYHYVENQGKLIM